MRQQQETAQKIASFLASHSLVNTVYYVGLSTHPGHDLHAKQSTGPGSVISFETKYVPDQIACFSCPFIYFGSLTQRFVYIIICLGMIISVVIL